MKRSLLFLLLAALSVGCEVGPSAQGLSTEPATWRGNPGTAVTIRFATGTEQLKGAEMVAFRFGHREPYHQGRNGEFWAIADFTVPVPEAGTASGDAILREQRKRFNGA